METSNLEIFIFSIIAAAIGFRIILILINDKKKCIKGQVALITGGEGELGKELAIELAKLGCHVAIVDNENEDIQKIVQELINFGVKAKVYNINISNITEVTALKNEIERDLGCVDIIINNAAILFSRRINDEDPNKIKDVIDVNVLSLFWTTNTFLESMINRKQGHIISIASLIALQSAPEAILYATSKFAMRGFMESLALDLHRNGHSSYIKTSTIYSTFIDTNQLVCTFYNQLIRNKLLVPMLKKESVVKSIINNILLNKEVIVIPSYNYYLGYLITMPLGLRKHLMKFLIRDDFNITKFVDHLENKCKTTLK